jgi:hypothetical protein
MQDQEQRHRPGEPHQRGGAFAAEGAPAWSPRWCFAWLAEPFCSLALLMVAGGRAYLTTRARPLDSRAADRAEWVFLALTVGMNAWPHLPWVTPTFTVSALVLHLLGPVVAVSVVRCLPSLLAAFNHLPTTATQTEPGDRPDRDRAPTTPTTPADATAPDTTADPGPGRPLAALRTGGRESSRARIPEPQRRTHEQLRAAFGKALTDRPDGFDPANAESIRRTLSCGKPHAARLRNEYRARTTNSTDSTDSTD